MSGPATGPFSLAGSTALVTGARGGIGRASALALADAGADVVLWGRRPDGLDEVAAQVRDRGRAVHVVVADLADPRAAAEQARRLGQDVEVDLLVNNAGVIDRAPALEVGLEDWRRVLTVDLDSVFALTQEVGRGMVARGRGRVVSIASMLSFQGGLRVASYTAAKHAVVGLTRALANEWGPCGVTVNAVAPGYVATDNTAALRADAERERAIRERIPLGRWAEPQDVAGSVVFLCSPAAAYVNGHVLCVDGGWMSR